MKRIIFLFSILSVLAVSISCNSHGTRKESALTMKTTGTQVYYFHFTRRCATCIAVEENARKAVEALYPNEVKTGDITFTALNLDEIAGKEIGGTLGVGGQTLLVVRGEKRLDITSTGFLNAHDLEKMKDEIKSAVDKVKF
jgi:hypothetical protein